MLFLDISLIFLDISQFHVFPMFFSPIFLWYSVSWKAYSIIWVKLGEVRALFDRNFQVCSAVLGFSSLSSALSSELHSTCEKLSLAQMASNGLKWAQTSSKFDRIFQVFITFLGFFLISFLEGALTCLVARAQIDNKFQVYHTFLGFSSISSFLQGATQNRWNMFFLAIPLIFLDISQFHFFPCFFPWYFFDIPFLGRRIQLFRWCPNFTQFHPNNWIRLPRNGISKKYQETTWDWIWNLEMSVELCTSFGRILGQTDCFTGSV